VRLTFAFPSIAQTVSRVREVSYLKKRCINVIEADARERHRVGRNCPNSGLESIIGSKILEVAIAGGVSDYTLLAERSHGFTVFLSLSLSLSVRRHDENGRGCVSILDHRSETERARGVDTSLARLLKATRKREKGKPPRGQVFQFLAPGRPRDPPPAWKSPRAREPPRTRTCDPRRDARLELKIPRFCIFPARSRS